MDYYDLEKRIKRIEDVTGITAEREREARAERFKFKRKLVLDRREARKAGVTLNQYYEAQNYYATMVGRMPKGILDFYNSRETK